MARGGSTKRMGGGGATARGGSTKRGGGGGDSWAESVKVPKKGKRRRQGILFMFCRLIGFEARNQTINLDRLDKPKARKNMKTEKVGVVSSQDLV